MSLRGAEGDAAIQATFQSKRTVEWIALSEQAPPRNDEKIRMKTKAFFLFGIILIGTCIALGIWQLERREEKRALIQTLEAQQLLPPQDIDALKNPEEFQKLFAKGSFLPQKTITLQSKVHEGKAGFFVLNVLKTREGKHILVQRGWSEAQNHTPPLNIEQVQGSVRFPSPPNFFQPKNTPPTYFWIDLPALSKDFGVPLEPYYLVLETSDDPAIVPTPPVPSLRNHHLEYTITWFSLAFFLLLMLVYFRKHNLIKDSK